MFLSFIILIFWLLILWYSANNFIWSSVKIARSLKVSEMMIWLTIVAMWTSAPELAVSAISALEWNWDLSIWNVIWSNIFNLWFILWLSAIIIPISIHKKMVFRDWLFLMFVISLVLFMLFDQHVWKMEWFILLSLLVWYNVFLWIKKDTHTEEEEIHEHNDLKTYFLLLTWLVVWLVFHTQSNWLWESTEFLINYWFKTSWIVLIWLSIFWLIVSFILKDIPSIYKKTKWHFYNIVILFLSLALLVVSSEQVVSSAVYIATYFWLSQWAIWATIVAAWTSLPEIAATVSAISKKKFDMWVWNVIWSDIFNILWIIWISSVLAPISLKWKCLFVDSCTWLNSFFIDNLFSVFVLIITLLITLLFMRTWWKLSKKEWLFLFTFACIRMAFEINPNIFVF